MGKLQYRQECAVTAERERQIAKELQIVNSDRAARKIERNQVVVHREDAETSLQTIEEANPDQREPLHRVRQESRSREDMAIGREAELIAQIRDLRTELDRRGEELEAQRQAFDEETAALCQELEAMFRHELEEADVRSVALAEQLDALRTKLEHEESQVVISAVSDEVLEPEHATEDVESLHCALNHLHNQVESLQRERDTAIEQAGSIRLECDRLCTRLALMEARLQEAEDGTRVVSVSLLRETGPFWHVEEDRIGNTAVPPSQIDFPILGTDPVPQIVGNPDPVISDPLVQADDAQENESRLAAAAAEVDAPAGYAFETTPISSVEESRDGAKPAAPVEPRSLPDESPEARIRSLRNALRDDHETRAREHSNRPFFGRLSRVWRKSNRTR